MVKLTDVSSFVEPFCIIFLFLFKLKVTALKFATFVPDSITWTLKSLFRIDGSTDVEFLLPREIFWFSFRLA